METYIKIDLERELQILINNGKTREEAVSLAIENCGVENANYLIEAYLMPIDEITKEIERYDSSKPKLDEIAFVNELCKRYNVNKKAIIHRIQDVRRINKEKENQTPERLAQLKNKRDMLQKEKDKLADKSMGVEEKSMFYFGLGVVTIVSGLLFYPASPILVGIIPVMYAVGLPTLRVNAMTKKEYLLINELVNLDRKIKVLDTNLNGVKEPVHYVDVTKSYISEEKINVSDEINNEVIINTGCEGPTLVKRRKKK